VAPQFGFSPMNPGFCGLGSGWDMINTSAGWGLGQAWNRWDVARGRRSRIFQGDTWVERG